MSTEPVNPVHPCEPLAEKVHAQKPPYSTVINIEDERYAPFLDMVWVVAERITTRHNCSHEQRQRTPSLSCAKKVHWVHTLRFPLSRLAIITVCLDLNWCIGGCMVHSGGEIA